ncbi:MAG TPA: DUF6531 domain-containing protein [Fibrobacteria bacterium]|nr:DUF6531 domain-containing protein [Fibrobacteria bacterium]
MMPAAKMMDPVLGIDIHIIQPPGPVPPVPIPHPFVGMLFDPMELAPFIGASVFINGMPKATAGSEGKALPPHIPIGGVFVPPPPGNECEMFMGSATVLFEGEPASYLALPALSCQSIGMPSPPRLKKKPKPILKLPTSVVLPIPMGPLVLIGGPPTISMTVIGMKLVMGAAGKAARKLRKMQKASKKIKAISDRIHKAARKAMDKLGVPPSARNKVHKSICTVTGHPVDVATGKVFTDNVDFELPGPLALRWERTWYSTSTYSGPLGHGWHHAYDISLCIEGKGLAVRMPDGRPRGFPVLQAGSEYFDRAEKITLARDAAGYFLRTKDHLTYRFSQAPDAGGIHPLVEIRTDAGHRLRFAYDSRGRLEWVLDSGGRRFRLVSDGQGRILEIQGPHPDDRERSCTLVSYLYDTRGDLVEARDSLGCSWKFRYQNHLLVQETNRNGLSFHFEYDGEGPDSRCTRTWGDGGIHDHKLQYDLQARTTTVVDSLGSRTVYKIVDSGLATEVIDPLGWKSSIIHDEFNEPLVHVDQLGGRTEYEYDDRGNCTKVSRLDGTVLEFKYKGDSTLLVKDALGGEWKWEYDERNRPTKRTDPLGRNLLFGYRGANLASLKDDRGSEIALQHDESHQIRSLKLANGAETRWEYDFLGRCRAIIDPRGNALRKDIDVAGQIRRVEEPDGLVRIFTYDPEGNVISAEEGRRKATFRYRGMNKLAERFESGVRVGFLYDTEERLIGVENEHGLVYRFRRGLRGDVDAEIGYDGMERKYLRDAKGRVTSLEKAGGTTTAYVHDAMDRILEARHGNGETETFVYAPDGQLLEAANGHSVVRYERDALGRVLKEVQGGHWVESGYDASGRRVSLRSSMGAWQTMDRDSMGDLLGITFASDKQPQDPIWEARFKRDLLGLELERTLPGGITSSWVRDPIGRPTLHSITRGNTRRTREYQWGAGRILTALKDSELGLYLFAHDSLGHLNGSKGPDGAYLFRLPDAVGNLFRSRAKDDCTYGPSGELLASTGPLGITHYEYDREGNLIRKSEPGGRTWIYEWNASGMMAGIIRPDGERVEFRYDALGRRISKAFKGRIRKWVWDDRNPLHEWVDDAPVPALPAGAPTSGAKAEEKAVSRRMEEFAGRQSIGPPADDPATETSPITWLFEPDSFVPMAKIIGRNRYSIVTDHIGTPLAMYDSQGRETWSALLDINGLVVSLKGDRDACPFRFRGQYEDAETGLYCNRFRYYDPSIGSYVSQDPLGQLSKLYSFVGDPTLAGDPFGLHEWVDPNDLNYSQAYVEGDTVDYERDMKNGDWDWDRKSKKGNNVAVLNVVEVDGQLVSMDNRRLLAAQNANLPKVPINRVNLDDIKPGTTITWRESLKRRLNSKPVGTNLPKVQLPPQGTKTKPTVVCS